MVFKSLVIFCIHLYSYSLHNFYPSTWADQRKEHDDMVVIIRVITKLLPSRQIVHSTQQVVYLAHANVHTNHLLISIRIVAATIVNKYYKNYAI